MNKSEITEYACKKLGIADTSTIALAGEFAKRRWSMIWNNALWRQSRTSAQLTTTPGEAIVNLPPTMEFAIAVRFGARSMLGSEEETSALASNPEAFGAQGTVATFSAMSKAADGTARIRLNQVPTTTETLMVFGKAKCPELNLGVDIPLIPGADECLCAFVLMDLSEWMRQYDAANRYKDEANALLSKMKEIEVSQVGEIRRFIPAVYDVDY